MSTYFVRDAASKELVGFFAASSLMKLVYLMIEYDDRGPWEYVRATDCGFHWPTPGTPVIVDWDNHTDTDGDLDEDSNFAGMIPSDHLVDALLSKKNRWKPLRLPFPFDRL